MKCLVLYTAGLIDTDGDTDSATPVDMTTKDCPFTPGSDVVAVLKLNNVVGDTNGMTILIEKSETTAGSDFTTEATQTIAAAAVEDDGCYFFNITIGQRLRVSTNGGTGAAGSYDLTLLAN